MNLPLTVIKLVLCSVFLPLIGCNGAGEASLINNDKSEVKILKISACPDPARSPYPNIASLCLCETATGERILVAIPAFKKRQKIEGFTKLKAGSKLRLKLVPWQERSAEARATFVADDIHEPELVLFFAESVDFP